MRHFILCFGSGSVATAVVVLAAFLDPVPETVVPFLERIFRLNAGLEPDESARARARAAAASAPAVGFCDALQPTSCAVKSSPRVPPRIHPALAGIIASLQTL